ncbi:MAG: thiamine pyrophosphate-binding protein [Desulfuromonadales bacterium]
MAQSVAELIVEFLISRKVDRVFGLQGAHIQPIWDHLAQRGVRIIDVRHESAAVHMAHAHAVLTGKLGVAMVTAGPGVTNCVTAIANADLERAPVLLIGGCAPRPQEGLGPLQGTPHTAIMEPVTRWSRTLRVADNVLQELDQAFSTALGDGNTPGPVYLEIPPDVLREKIHQNLILQEFLHPRALRVIPPGQADIAQAVKTIAMSKRPLVVTGRGARGSSRELCQFLDLTGAIYLDTQESRGLVPPEHPSVVSAIRARAFREADLVIVIGRILDYQLGYGSPAIFPEARFIRIGDCWEELRKNRRGEVEIFATPALALNELINAGVSRPSSADENWAQELREEHVRRSAKYIDSLKTSPTGKDGYMHPNRIFAALHELLDSDAVTIADGGDILSFARLGLPIRTYLDSGAFGCLGVGTPYGIAAALCFPTKQVVVVSGDGAFGINAMEIDSAKRHAAKTVFIIANNAAWNIERIDQELNFAGRVVGTTLQYSDYAMMARAFGLHAERVTDPGHLSTAIETALINAPSLVDVVITRDAMSSDSRKGLGVTDYQALATWDEAECRRRS